MNTRLPHLCAVAHQKDWREAGGILTKPMLEDFISLWSDIQKPENYEAARLAYSLAFPAGVLFSVFMRIVAGIG